MINVIIYLNINLRWEIWTCFQGPFWLMDVFFYYIDGKCFEKWEKHIIVEAINCPIYRKSVWVQPVDTEEKTQKEVQTENIYLIVMDHVDICYY